jgi:hypothetical protein
VIGRGYDKQHEDQGFVFGFGITITQFVFGNQEGRRDGYQATWDGRMEEDNHALYLELVTEQNM